MPQFTLTPPSQNEESDWRLEFTTLEGVPPQKIMDYIEDMLGTDLIVGSGDKITVHFTLEEKWKWPNLKQVIEWLANENRSINHAR